MNERSYMVAERTTLIYTVLLVGIGAFEVVVATVSHSISVYGDGISSFGDAVITAIIWAGIRLSRRPPSQSFQFGYLRVESLALVFAAFGMLVTASFLLYQSYQRLFSPVQLTQLQASVAAVLLAGALSFAGAIMLRRASAKHRLVSLRIGAMNGEKDSTSSIIVLIAVLLSSIGVRQADGLGGLIVGGYIVSIAYVALKEASLVLIDAIDTPDVREAVREAMEKHPVEVKDIRLRRSGVYLTGRVALEADGEMLLRDAGAIKEAILRDLVKHGIRDLSIDIKPKSSRTEERKDLLR